MSDKFDRLKQRQDNAHDAGDRQTPEPSDLLLRYMGRNSAD